MSSKKFFLLNISFVLVLTLIAKAKVFGNSKVIAEIIDDINMDGLRILNDKIKEKEKSVVIVLATKDGEKASFITSLTEDLAKKDLDAGAIAKEVAGLIDGSGGGKPNFAQGGGKSPDKLAGALKKITEIIAKSF